MNQRAVFYTVFAGCAMLGSARADQSTAAPVATRLSDSHLHSASVDQLNRAYLECDSSATHRMLDPGEAALCSMVHEALKQRAFGGDFARMLAWWKSARVAAATVPRR